MLQARGSAISDPIKISSELKTFHKLSTGKKVVYNKFVAISMGEGKNIPMVRRVYGKQQPIKIKDASVEVEKKSVIYWLLIGFLVFFLFWAPFQKGLFNGNSFDFERPIYSSLIWTSIFLFMLSIRLFFIWKPRDHRDVLSFFVLLIPLTYLISLIHAASHHLAMNMLYIQMMYVTFFILGAFLLRNKFGYSIISGALMASGYFIVIFGLLNWFGNAKFASALVGWFTGINGSRYERFKWNADNLCFSVRQQLRGLLDCYFTDINILYRKITKMVCCCGTCIHDDPGYYFILAYLIPRSHRYIACCVANYSFLSKNSKADPYVSSSRTRIRCYLCNIS
jgi:hypothetical protein